MEAIQRTATMISKRSRFIARLMATDVASQGRAGMDAQPETWMLSARSLEWGFWSLDYLDDGNSMNSTLVGLSF